MVLNNRGFPQALRYWNNI